MGKDSKPSDIIVNKKARHDFTVMDTHEAGIVLKGTEVKAVRNGLAQIREAFIRVDHGQVWLHNANIEEYSHGNQFNHKPTAARKLLLHKKEIEELFHKSNVPGNTLVPLRLYWKKNKIKVEVGVCKGKAQHDRRQDIKERDADREMKRALAASRR